MQLYYTLIYPYLIYAVVVWGNIRYMYFADSRESSQVFYKLFDEYSLIRYLTSPPLFLHCLVGLSEQSLACTSITSDTPPRVIFIDQK